MHCVKWYPHWKHPPWACPFSGVKFCGAFHFQKAIFLQLLQIWSSYCFHCDTDQLWMHTQSNNKTKCLKWILLTVKNPTSICTPFGSKSYVYIHLCNAVFAWYEKVKVQHSSHIICQTRNYPCVAFSSAYCCIKIYISVFQFCILH